MESTVPQSCMLGLSFFLVRVAFVLTLKLFLCSLDIGIEICFGDEESI